MIFRTYSIWLVFLIGVYVSSAEEEECFDKPKMTEKYADAVVKCRNENPKGTEKRQQKITLCLFKEHDIVDKDFNFNIDKVKEEADEVTLKYKDELKKVIDDCWEGAQKRGVKTRVE